MDGEPPCAINASGEVGPRTAPPSTPGNQPADLLEDAMSGETTVTIVGNLTADPELRFTQSGAAVANFTVASTPRTFDGQSGEWKDGQPLFMRCSQWRQPGENLVESLTKGARVIVQGRLSQRSFETSGGEKRTVIELNVAEIGPSLRYATAKVEKRAGNGGGGGKSSADGYDDAPPF